MKETINQRKIISRVFTFIKVNSNLFILCLTIVYRQNYSWQLTHLDSIANFCLVNYTHNTWIIFLETILLKTKLFASFICTFGFKKSTTESKLWKIHWKEFFRQSIVHKYADIMKQIINHRKIISMAFTFYTSN